jgi:hypothetical protein
MCTMRNVSRVTVRVVDSGFIRQSIVGAKVGQFSELLLEVSLVEHANVKVLKDDYTLRYYSSIFWTVADRM